MLLFKALAPERSLSVFKKKYLAVFIIICAQIFHLWLPFCPEAY